MPSFSRRLKKEKTNTRMVRKLLPREKIKIHIIILKNSGLEILHNFICAEIQDYLLSPQKNSKN